MTRCEPPYHRVGCTGCYNADTFDAELAVERSGHAFFDKDELADLLGLSVHSLGAQRARGKIPAPDHYLEPDGRRSTVSGGHRRAVWTPEQATQILVARKATG